MFHSVYTSSSTMELKTDVFPKRVITDMADIGELPQVAKFKELIAHYKIFPFIIYLDFVKIYFRSVEWTKVTIKHFNDTGMKIKYKDISKFQLWESTADALKKEIDETSQKNVTQRTSFKFNNHNFLVKSKFTFGQRTVEEGTVHVYQIGAVPMAIYILDELCRQKVKVQERVFKPDDQFNYRMKTLQANHNFLVPSGTTYLIYTGYYSYFSVHIVSEQCPVLLQLNCQNVLTYIPPPPPKRILYQRPPATPQIEEVEEVYNSDVVLMTLPTGEVLMESACFPSYTPEPEFCYSEPPTSMLQLCYSEPPQPETCHPESSPIHYEPIHPESSPIHYEPIHPEPSPIHYESIPESPASTLDRAHWYQKLFTYVRYDEPPSGKTFEKTHLIARDYSTSRKCSFIDLDNLFENC